MKVAVLSFVNESISGKVGYEAGVMDVMFNKVAHKNKN
jgi:hypothetical protein